MKQFAAKTARPLPVIILADVSGSMEGEKIDALNRALRGMLVSFAKESRLNAEIQVALVTFGEAGAVAHVPLMPAYQITGLKELIASGTTPMGSAFRLVTQLLEDKERIPSRAYRPTLVLVSDGYPDNDGWQMALEELSQSERAQKATHMAMAIGNDADKKMLKSFINDPEIPLFESHQHGDDMMRFFRAVSMSVSSRSRSTTPNQILKIDFDSLPDDELDLSNF